MMQNAAQNQMNFAGNLAGMPASNTDILGQLNTFGQSNMLTGNQPNEIVQSNFIRQNRNMPNVVTLNGQSDISVPNSLGSNVDSGQTGQLQNTNSANDIRVVEVNQNQRFSNNVNSGPLEDNNSFSNVGRISATPERTGVQTEFSSSVSVPESTSQTNTTFSQPISSPFGFPSTSASFWTGFSSSGSTSSLPGQPPFIESNTPSADTASWNRFMTGSGLFGSADTTAGTTAPVNGFPNTNSNPPSSIDFTTGTQGTLSSSVSDGFTNTLQTGNGFTGSVNPSTGESINTPPPAVFIVDTFTIITYILGSIHDSIPVES